jgi:hypothetical protein
MVYASCIKNLRRAHVHHFGREKGLHLFIHPSFQKLRHSSICRVPSGSDLEPVSIMAQNLLHQANDLQYSPC